MCTLINLNKFISKKLKNNRRFIRKLYQSEERSGKRNFIKK